MDRFELSVVWSVSFALVIGILLGAAAQVVFKDQVVCPTFETPKCEASPLLKVFSDEVDTYLITCEKGEKPF